MSSLVRQLFFLTLFAVVITLAKDIPPFRVYLLDVFLVPLAIAVLVQKAMEPRRVSFEWAPIDTVFLLMSISVSLAYVFSEDIRHSTVGFLDWVRIAVVYFLARALSGGIVTSESYSRWSLLVLSVLMTVGLLQIFTGTSVGLVGNYFGGGVEQGVDAHVQGVGSMIRVSGTTSNPIVYAVWVTLLSLVVMSSAIAKGRFVVFVAISGLSAVLVVSTLSRGAIASFAVSWLLMTLLARPQLRRAGAVVSVMLFALIAIPGAYLLYDRLGIEDRVSMLEARLEHHELLEEDSGRVKAIRMGIELLSEPKVVVLGTGPDNLVYGYSLYASNIRSLSMAGADHVRSGIHNVWIKLLVEYGILSGLLYIVFWVMALGQANQLRKRTEKRDVPYALATAALAFLLPFLFIDSSVYESAMSYHILIPVMAIVGMVVTQAQQIERVRGTKARQSVGKVMVGLDVPQWKRSGKI